MAGQNIGRWEVQAIIQEKKEGGVWKRSEVTREARCEIMSLMVKYRIMG